MSGKWLNKRSDWRLKTTKYSIFLLISHLIQCCVKMSCDSYNERDMNHDYYFRFVCHTRNVRLCWVRCIVGYRTYPAYFGKCSLYSNWILHIVYILQKFCGKRPFQLSAINMQFTNRLNSYAQHTLRMRNLMNTNH